MPLRFALHLLQLLLVTNGVDLVYSEDHLHPLRGLVLEATRNREASTLPEAVGQQALEHESGVLLVKDVFNQAGAVPVVDEVGAPSEFPTCLLVICDAARHA